MSWAKLNLDFLLSFDIRKLYLQPYNEAKSKMYKESKKHCSSSRSFVSFAWNFSSLWDIETDDKHAAPCEIEIVLCHVKAAWEVFSNLRSYHMSISS